MDIKRKGQSIQFKENIMTLLLRHIFDVMGYNDQIYTNDELGETDVLLFDANCVFWSELFLNVKNLHLKFTWFDNNWTATAPPHHFHP